MNKKFENCLAMFKAVLSLLERFNATWQSVNAFSDSVNQMKAKCTAIDQLRKKGESGSKGVTQLKKSLKEKLITQAFGVSASMMVCFVKSDDKVLLQRVKTTKSDLKKLRDGQLIAKAKDLLELGREKLQELASYQVTESILNEMETTVNQFENQSISPRLSIGERKTANADLDDLFKAVNFILSNELDMMMVSFEKSAPDFYREYQNARKVVDYGTRHEKDDDDDDAPTGEDTGNK